MPDDPDISLVASVIGNPANATMLLALIPGLALTATELAGEAGLALPTVSGHLARLQQAGLVTVERQGRHRYFRLAGQDVVALLEALLPVAARAGHMRSRSGPRDPELRRARSCYDHLAGDLAVRMLDAFVEGGAIRREGDDVAVTVEGRRFFVARGIDVAAAGRSGRPLCRFCLDWSERRSHLSGSLGAAVFEHIQALGWASRQPGSRIVRFGRGGEAAIDAWYSA